MIWQIREGEATEVHGFDPGWLPLTGGELVALRWVARGGERVLTLQARKHVGFLPLENGDTLQIAPKLGDQTFWRMLLVSEGLDRAMRQEFDGLTKAAVDDTNGQNAWQIVADQFASAVAEIQEKSAEYGRRKRRERRESIKGRVNLFYSMRNSVLRKPAPFECVYQERYVETPENRLLASACVRALNSERLGHLQRLAMRSWVEDIGRWDLTSEESTVINRRLGSGFYFGPRGYYLNALLLAKIVTSRSSIVFETREDVASHNVLSSVANLFEAYLRRTLQQTFECRSCVVFKDEKSPSALFTDGSCKLFPDIIIAAPNGQRYFVDAKYKFGVEDDESDIYQMFSYLTACGVGAGALVRPTEPGEASSVYSRTTVTGKRIAFLRLDFRQYLEAEKALVDFCETFFSLPAGKAI
jgi:hypothetical protein